MKDQVEWIIAVAVILVLMTTVLVLAGAFAGEQYSKNVCMTTMKNEVCNGK